VSHSSPSALLYVLREQVLTGAGEAEGWRDKHVLFTMISQAQLVEHRAQLQWWAKRLAQPVREVVHRWSWT
jgi:hypothetical protein